jgi:hypothetical protein
LSPVAPPVITLPPAVTLVPSHTDQIGASAARLVSALAASNTTSLSPRDAVVIAEAISSGRSALFQCLIDLGWTPPPGVQDAMALDARLIGEGLGANYEGMRQSSPVHLA